MSHILNRKPSRLNLELFSNVNLELYNFSKNVCDLHSTYFYKHKKTV